MTSFCITEEEIKLIVQLSISQRGDMQKQKEIFNILEWIVRQGPLDEEMLRNVRLRMLQRGDV